MTFTSSAKTVTSHIDTPGIRKLEQACGGRLTELTQREKYQLSEVISGFLASMVADDENPGDEAWTILDHLKDGYHDVANNVTAVVFILQHEDCGALAHLLPAIAEYARDDK